MTARHPARFSDAILVELDHLVPAGALVLDPFAGTGRIHELGHVRTVGVEIEPEWAAMHPGTIVADALALPFASDTFDCVCTSPCYGNRLADHHHARDGSTRRSYTHDLGRPLHPNNAGVLHWGPAYRSFHRAAWAEAMRVLRPGSRLILNISDHIRADQVQRVTDWHISTLADLGLDPAERLQIPTPRLRYGANANARVDHETIAVFARPTSVPRCPA